jgi:hypothetical protein
MQMILPGPVHPPRSGRPTRSVPVWQDIVFKKLLNRYTRGRSLV